MGTAGKFARRAFAPSSTVMLSLLSPPHATAITVPMLLVRGTESEMVSDAELAAFRAVAPGAEHVDVPTARHMVAGDQNDLFTAAVVEFLLRHLTPESAG